ncbi:LOW QUALITY PROTEIN: hypothetical protein FGSG_12844 [Fusarium graminearum PH-1]|uniref:hypothetical protein n=1 Tax=Gibberella zeae (strain ATCC MYA-4620 / CBS 123657 / FGSC 9075 / NRRL 31084 / PH-1) TaxID=229533 RepID=UPI00021F1764|nr:LOW QUALITY PROTEIN: hypothetical protein FGSG_12844 [Fusarium graminearum PH-1]ESU11992.1 LOW QUALITY PROTEIN: hypothetical protein FGSG_12844 [Fusarium graminearum PH-1]|eukprot:XP_011324568.1 LOW QUALITY PROTEIN: hypothetical protein FGSG_12844 [Fusarium graminearum PH-1]
MECLGQAVTIREAWTEYACIYSLVLLADVYVIISRKIETSWTFQAGPVCLQENFKRSNQSVPRFPTLIPVKGISAARHSIINVHRTRDCLYECRHIQSEKRYEWITHSIFVEI